MGPRLAVAAPHRTVPEGSAAAVPVVSGGPYLTEPPGLVALAPVGREGTGR